MSDTLSEFLQHYGIKGMKWGIRRSDKQLGKTSSSGDSPDAVRAKETLSKIRSAKSLSAVSNDDLNHLKNRLELEKKFTDLNPNILERTNKTAKTVIKYGTTMNEAYTLYNSPLGKAIRDILGPVRPYGRHSLASVSPKHYKRN